ncbi:hypothetical protein SB49_01380 [Sediminicola sp. YIK13]|uniref:hypothetical protein n=1 Tax=Sediminicola sp. YIK13 TaxID=1453352 RepID=UPI0007221B40|nr:hypothetical protein [Sediminicola sp. YIK13]ALM09107.1 hypothetical protein SB49_01380 [Sediminicola sp. YIK13]
MVFLSKWILILFGIFLIGVAFLMLLYPTKARATISKAGSTPLINYMEITLRMVPAAALVLYADFSNYPMLFLVLGWFMLATSLVLYFVPRRLHHQYALKCAAILNPTVIRIISPLSLLFGILIIYATIS